MFQDIQQQQGNRAERRQMQRKESKKWRREEKKMSLAGPNAGRYNPKKSRKGTNSISRKTTNPFQNHEPSDRSHSTVSIKNRDFIIIDKVFDYTPNDKHIDFSQTDSDNKDTLEIVKMQEKKAEENQAIPSIVSDENDNGNTSTILDKMVKSDFQIVTVSEDPVFNEKIDDEISETLAVKSDTVQEKLQNMNETAQIVDENKQSDSCASLQVSPVEQEQEPLREIPLKLKTKDIVPTPSADKESLNVINNDPVVDKTLQLDAKNISSKTLLADKIILSTTIPTTTTSTITASTTTSSTTVASNTTTVRTKKRSIVSRLFKNNKIEIKVQELSIFDVIF